MAYRKKYKPCILKYKALILKYVPYIFDEKRHLIFNNLQNPQKESNFVEFNAFRQARCNLATDMCRRGFGMSGFVLQLVYFFCSKIPLF